MKKTCRIKKIKNWYLRFSFLLIQSDKKRVEFLKKHHLLAEIGTDVHWATRFYPIDGECLKLHNNIVIARDVNFIMHDEMHLVLNNLDKGREWINQEYGVIEIMDNVSIGSGAQICPNVRIGPNAIVGAGAVVVNDVPPNSVVGGVPAKVIGSFEEFEKKRVKLSKRFNGLTKDQKKDLVWEEFYRKRD